MPPAPPHPDPLAFAADRLPGRRLLRWTDEAAFDGDVAAVAIDERNPLAEGWTPPSGDVPVVVWSGTLADELFGATPLNWTSPGAEGLAGLLDRLDAADRGRLLLRPHARHVLSDPPSVRAWCRARTDAPVTAPAPGVATDVPVVAGFVLDPVSLLEPVMLDDAADHLFLLPRNLGDLSRVVLLADVEVAPGPDGAPACRPVPPGRGRFDDAAWEALTDAIAAFVPSEVPVAVRVEGG